MDLFAPVAEALAAARTSTNLEDATAKLQLTIFEDALERAVACVENLEAKHVLSDMISTMKLPKKTL